VNAALLLALPLAALLQASAVPLLFLDTAQAPVLPVATLAAWATAHPGPAARAYGGRAPRPPLPVQVWLAVPPAALVLGWLSTDAVGAVLLALLPAVLALEVVRAPGGSLPAVLGAAAAAGGGGAIAYGVLLLLLGGGALVSALPALVVGATWTAALASAGALALAPWRRRAGGGLFA